MPTTSLIRHSKAYTKHLCWRVYVEIRNPQKHFSNRSGPSANEFLKRTKRATRSTLPCCGPALDFVEIGMRIHCTSIFESKRAKIDTSSLFWNVDGFESICVANFLRIHT